MLKKLTQFDYLLRMIREDQKKTLTGWIGLIRSALVEVDEAIGSNIIVLENPEPVRFEEFRKYMDRIAADLQLAKEASPLTGGKPSSRVIKTAEAG